MSQIVDFRDRVSGQPDCSDSKHKAQREEEKIECIWHQGLRMLALTVTVGVVLLVLLTRVGAHTHEPLTPYRANQRFQMECKLPKAVFDSIERVDDKPGVSEDGEWMEAWVCQESGFPIGFEFGRDKFISCGLKVNAAWYEFITEIVQNERVMQCRVGMDGDSRFYLPVSVGVWGLVEPDHMHINYHIQFVFHADEGMITGVAAYPVKDRFQVVKIDSTLNFHGPVRWFKRHSYTPYSGSEASVPSLTGIGAKLSGTAGNRGFWWWFLYTLFVIVGVVVMSSVLYFAKLKPALVKQYLKRD